MSQSYQTGGKTMTARLAARQPHELLLLLGATVSVLLSLVLFGIRWSQGIAAGAMANDVTLVVLDVVLGAALWFSAQITRKNLVNGAIVAGVVSIVLIAFGGEFGVIGGVIGLIGAILAAATPYLPWSKRASQS
jgi:hypothetical protein